MSLLDYIENIRHRPTAERKKLLVIWTITGTFIITALWLINALVFMPYADYDDLARLDGQSTANNSFLANQLDRVYTGFTVVKDSLSTVYSHFLNLFD